MDDANLYNRIAEMIRRQILTGEIKPGERLPGVREMTLHWQCSIGTVQRAYRNLASTGLVDSRPGKGTFVTDILQPDHSTPLRRAGLVHKAEAFLLEALTAGHTIDEIEQGVMIALDRWRVIQPEPAKDSPDHSIIFTGSHDPGIAWLAGHFSEIHPGKHFEPRFMGSLAGLIALASEKSDIAGIHLWDEQSNSYNVPYVRRLFPGKKVALIHFAYRRLGLITATGNPLRLLDLADLARPEVRFINRQSGSGTRVWLDWQLRLAGINSTKIYGYDLEVQSHSAVARAIVENKANCGFGLETSAIAFNLDFNFLTREEYHLVVPVSHISRPVVQQFIEWLSVPAVKKAIAALGGYETARMGEIEILDL